MDSTFLHILGLLYIDVLSFRHNEGNNSLLVADYCVCFYRDRSRAQFGNHAIVLGPALAWYRSNRLALEHVVTYDAHGYPSFSSIHLNDDQHRCYGHEASQKGFHEGPDGRLRLHVHQLGRPVHLWLTMLPLHRLGFFTFGCPHLLRHWHHDHHWPLLVLDLPN